MDLGDYLYSQQNFLNSIPSGTLSTSSSSVEPRQLSLLPGESLEKRVLNVFKKVTQCPGVIGSILLEKGAQSYLKYKRTKVNAEITGQNTLNELLVKSVLQDLKALEDHQSEKKGSKKFIVSLTSFTKFETDLTALSQRLSSATNSAAQQAVLIPQVSAVAPAASLIGTISPAFPFSATSTLQAFFLPNLINPPQVPPTWDTEKPYMFKPSLKGRLREDVYSLKLSWEMTNLERDQVIDQFKEMINFFILLEDQEAIASSIVHYLLLHSSSKEDYLRKEELQRNYFEIVNKTRNIFSNAPPLRITWDLSEKTASEFHFSLPLPPIKLPMDFPKRGEEGRNFEVLSIAAIPSSLRNSNPLAVKHEGNAPTTIATSSSQAAPPAKRRRTKEGSKQDPSLS